jgi:hypothetical protein
VRSALNVGSEGKKRSREIKLLSISTNIFYDFSPSAHAEQIFGYMHNSVCFRAHEARTSGGWGWDCVNSFAFYCRHWNVAHYQLINSTSQSSAPRVLCDNFEVFFSLSRCEEKVLPSICIIASQRWQMTKFSKRSLRSGRVWGKLSSTLHQNEEIQASSTSSSLRACHSLWYHNFNVADAFLLPLPTHKSSLNLNSINFHLHFLHSLTIFFAVCRCDSESRVFGKKGLRFSG